MQNGYGNFIKQHRIKSGYKSQRKLAKVSGISAATISRIEGEIQKPEVSTLKDISLFLTSTSFDELMKVCGYSYQDEKVTNEITDMNIVSKLGLTIDHEKITDEELKGLIVYIRTYRQVNKK